MYNENGSRIRPTRPAPSIPNGLSRNSARRSAPPQPPRRQSTLNEGVIAASQNSDLSQPAAAPRRSAPNLERQSSIEDNTQNVRHVKECPVTNELIFLPYNLVCACVFC